MKKLFALLLAMVLVFAFCACQPADDTSSPDASKAESSQPEDSSEIEDSSEPDDPSEPEDSSEPDDPSEPEDSSEPDESSEPDNEIKLPDFTNKFVVFGVPATSDKGAYAAKIVDTGTLSTGENSIRLTSVNDLIGEGHVAYFNADYGPLLPAGTYDDYAILVCEWDQSVFNYVLKKYYAVGENSEKDSINVPDDGFVIVAHKSNSEYEKLSKVTAEDIVVPVGVSTPGLEETIEKTKKAPTIDGKVDSKEYGLPVWTVDENNEWWVYSDFIKGEYYSTAEIYMTYDADNLYVGVVVNSPYHHCPLSQADAGSMWQYECIQVNVISVAPDSELMSQYFDWGSSTAEMNTYLSTQNIFNQYGFGVSSTDKSALSCCWVGSSFAGTYAGTRDDANGTTTYEVSIPWSSFGNEDNPASGEKGYSFGFAVSVNSTNEDSGWRNIFMRNGGGVIGRNDLSKSAKITLG